MCSIRWPQFIIIIIIKGNDWQIVNQKPISVIHIWFRNCTAHEFYFVHRVRNWKSLNWVNASNVLPHTKSWIRFSMMMDGNNTSNNNNDNNDLRVLRVWTQWFRRWWYKIKSVRVRQTFPSSKNRRIRCRNGNKKTISFGHFNGSLFVKWCIFIFLISTVKTRRNKTHKDEIASWKPNKRRKDLIDQIKMDHNRPIKCVHTLSRPPPSLSLSLFCAFFVNITSQKMPKIQSFATNMVELLLLLLSHAVWNRLELCIDRRRCSINSFC